MYDNTIAPYSYQLLPCVMHASLVTRALESHLQSYGSLTTHNLHSHAKERISLKSTSFSGLTFRFCWVDSLTLNRKGKATTSYLHFLFPPTL